MSKDSLAGCPGSCEEPCQKLCWNSSSHLGVMDPMEENCATSGACRMPPWNSSFLSKCRTRMWPYLRMSAPARWRPVSDTLRVIDSQSPRIFVLLQHS